MIAPPVRREMTANSVVRVVMIVLVIQFGELVDILHVLDWVSGST